MTELQEAMPSEMHPLAHIFMHPPTDGPGSTPMRFEPEHMNALAIHCERQGLAQVNEPLDRYDPPREGPIHPHNPGSWVPKDRPEPAAVNTTLALVQAKIAELSPHDRADLLATWTPGEESEEATPEVREDTQ